MFEKLKSAGHGGAQAISYKSEDEDGPEEPGLGMTIDEVLANKTFIEANAYAQKHIDANLRVFLEDIPLDPDHVIRVPTLFRDANFGIGFGRGDGLPPDTPAPMENERQMMEFYPASINEIVLGMHYLSPKPYGPVINGTDVLQGLVEEAYARAGMSVGYVDDYLSHHVGAGEIHCGSNTLRQTDMIWWH